jgi:predicted short-subunit dehydrogenase-like oxidoreductase (DUF2520 family)
MPERERDGRLGVGIIGAGKVGPVLGAALAGAGHGLVGIAAISEESRERAHAMLPEVPIMEVPRLVELSELVLIAVPDDELPGLISGLATAGVWQPGQLVLHTSPVYGIDVLKPAVDAGVIPLALHPAMAFTGTSVDVVRLADCFIAVTAPTPVLPIGMALAVEMGGEPFVVTERQRPDYADAILTASQFSAAIIEQVTAQLGAIGIERPGAILAPLIRSAVDNALGRAGDVSRLGFPELED